MTTQTKEHTPDAAISLADDAVREAIRAAANSCSHPHLMDVVPHLLDALQCLEKAGDILLPMNNKPPSASVVRDAAAPATTNDVEF